LNKDIDCILLGRKLAEGFIPHWKMEATDPTKKRGFVKTMSESYDFAEKMYKTNKVVFTKSLDKSEWDNTILAKGNLVEEINKLKLQIGKDIIVYGGSSFVSSLIKAGQIDEFHLFVNPAALGEGMSIFNTLEKKQNLALKKSIAFKCGIVLMCYEPIPG
jgi:dihydrofolate reductase